MCKKPTRDLMSGNRLRTGGLLIREDSIELDDIQVGYSLFANKLAELRFRRQHLNIVVRKGSNVPIIGFSLLPKIPGEFVYDCHDLALPHRQVGSHGSIKLIKSSGALHDTLITKL